MKLYVFQLVKEILIDSITPQNFLRWRVDRCGSVLDKFSSENGLARTARTCHDGCEWMFEIHLYIFIKLSCLFILCEQARLRRVCLSSTCTDSARGGADSAMSGAERRGLGDERR